MTWTFGIITAGESPHLEAAIRSIYKHGPQEPYKIVVVGGDSRPDGVDVWVPFDETRRDAWISLKKNIITHCAVDGTICFMHDYVKLCPGWAEAVDAFGYEWQTCMHQVLNQDGQRYRDWCVIDTDWYVDGLPEATPPERPGLLKYDNNFMHRWQYYSGAYWCARKEVMMRVPLNEELCWGQGEDVDWSRRVYREYGDGAFTMNANASVQFSKYKDPVPWQRLPTL